MAEIKKIRCVWNNEHDSTYNNICEGEIILEEDGWFEGLVNEPTKGIFFKNRLVFGVNYDNKYICLFRLAPNESWFPLIFRWKEYDQNSRGIASMVQDDGELLLGSSTIEIGNIKESLYYRSIEQQQKDLEKRTHDYKVCDEFREKYNAVLSKKEEFIKKAKEEVINNEAVFDIETSEAAKSFPSKQYPDDSSLQTSKTVFPDEKTLKLLRSKK